ncbi:MAG: hypothetical protein H6624_14165 [Bdellovibrionaceae bacterium]|nr:hypothetical protein [Bdellovibrionales bacterium]MCB9085487.1 hypothetical protein [Pseudobdellovibrionaceae bacterium]
MGKLAPKKDFLIKERSELLNGSRSQSAGLPTRERSLKLLNIEKQLAKIDAKKKI